jgi:uridylate kinase
MAVLYTPMDLSVGLVGQQVDGIYGYDPKTASAMMASLLQYADANR